MSGGFSASAPELGVPAVYSIGAVGMYKFLAYAPMLSVHAQLLSFTPRVFRQSESGDSSTLYVTVISPPVVRVQVSISDSPPFPVHHEKHIRSQTRRSGPPPVVVVERGDRVTWIAPYDEPSPQIPPAQQNQREYFPYLLSIIS